MARPSADAGFTSLTEPSVFKRELERARRNLARLEADQRASMQAAARPDEPVRFDESPTFARICNVLIWAIVLLPIALGVIALVRRLTA